MKFRLVAHWPSADILPTIEEHGSARTASRRYRQLMRGGMSSVSIFVSLDNSMKRLSPTALLRRAQAEPKSALRFVQARKTIASALLGVLASALPNSFGDFGVVPSWGMLRAARSSRSGRRRSRLAGDVLAERVRIACRDGSRNSTGVVLTVPSDASMYRCSTEGDARPFGG